MVNEIEHDRYFSLLSKESDRLLNEFIPSLCTIINTTASRSLAQIALDTIKNVLEEIKLEMLKHVSLLEKIAHSIQKVLNYKVTNSIDFENENKKRSIFFLLFKKAKCQQENDDENEDDDGRDNDGRDDAEYDAMLISTAGDLLPALTSIACTGKVPFYPTYLGSIIPKLQKRLVRIKINQKIFRMFLLSRDIKQVSRIVRLLSVYLLKQFKI